MTLAVSLDSYKTIKEELDGKNVTLVAVSKTKPVEDILALYSLGQRDFGENYVGELTGKHEQLPSDICWHFIGHLQSNKVKYIAPFVSLIHGVDSKKLLIEIDKQAAKNRRVIDCLLQVYIAKEETKFGLDDDGLQEILGDGMNPYPNVQICGLMGMASFTGNVDLVRSEFKFLKSLFDQYFKQKQVNTENIMARVSGQKTDASLPGSRQQPILSMGMSADYKIAIEEGSNMVRIGSLLFGERG